MPHDVMDLFPADTPPYMASAWVGCISWALGDPGTVAAFRRDTGVQWTPGATSIERMVDEATGAEWEFLKRFVRWANVNAWGPLDGEGE